MILCTDLPKSKVTIFTMFSIRYNKLDRRGSTVVINKVETEKKLEETLENKCDFS